MRTLLSLSATTLMKSKIARIRVLEPTTTDSGENVPRGMTRPVSMRADAGGECP
jgi:hypothetical protein